MAKVAFSKLKCKINDTEVAIQVGQETIMVKQYLPIQDKLGLIGRIIELSHEEDYNFSNPVKANVITTLEIIFAYTNIAFTDKQKEDSAKLYDLLASSDIISEVFKNIPEEELNTIYRGVEDTAKAFYAYQNSVLGLLDGIKKNYNETVFDVNKLQETVQQMAESPLVKDILPLLGLN